jgi:ABC-type transport system involved in cytochrome c biogenesis permease subunit
MFKRATLQERAEIVLILLLALAFLLVAQQASQSIFKIGMGLLVISTFLEICVANVPPEASRAKLLRLVGLFLSIIVALFALGIYLVPFLTDLGR